MKLNVVSGYALAMLFSTGAAQAADVTLVMPACASFSFNSETSVLTCNESNTPATTPVCSVTASPTSVTTGGTSTIGTSCSPAATSYVWEPSATAPEVTGSGGVITFPTAGTYTYRVTGSNDNGAGTLSALKTITVTDPAPVGSCTTPAGTTVISIGSNDSYAKKSFDTVWDNPGSTFDSAVAAGSAKALAFTNSGSKSGYISATSGNYGAGYKDWSLSLCQGDFTASLGDKCVLTKKNSIQFAYSTDGSQGCTIPVNQTVYLNVRGNNGIAAGFVIQNLQASTLP